MTIENRKIKWAFLCSFWGKNAHDIIKLYAQKKLMHTEISLVIYEQEPCGAAEIATATNIETLFLSKNNYENNAAYQQTLSDVLKKRNIDFIFLLGYQHIIKETMLSAFPNRIINIHPSLFPSFLGTKTAIQDALDYGVKITGITTHIIDHKIDYGTILFQRAIEVAENDTFESLYPKFSKEGVAIIKRTIQHMNATLLKS